MTVLRGAGVGVMIVVPAFAIGEEPDNPGKTEYEISLAMCPVPRNLGGAVDRKGQNRPSGKWRHEAA
jgi:hypothetical protein